MTETEAAGRTLGMLVTTTLVGNPGEVDRAFTAMRDTTRGASSWPWHSDRTGARSFSRRSRSKLPTVSGAREFVEAGGLMAYGPDYPDLYRRAATFVDKILKGAKPGDIPIEQPTKFQLVINLKTAKALGVTIPPALLARADEVME